MPESENDNEILKQADQLRLSGEYEKAISLLSELCEKNPFLAPAKLSLGRAYFEYGKLDQAVSVLEEFVDFVPDHGLANKILARIYVHQKRIEEARVKIQIVLAETPQDPVALKLQKEIEMTGFEEVEDDETVKTSTPALTTTMAELYYHQGHVKEARKIYEQLLLHDPQNKDLQEKLRLIQDEVNPSQNLEAQEPQEVIAMQVDYKPQQSEIAHKSNPIELLEMLLARVQERRRSYV
ncbi:MAG: tetratricopeptide repeat protein [Bdellovibrionales bacterium]|nr:tetratricopeptide repeat protein [Bdellovibrionales bacterium]